MNSWIPYSHTMHITSEISPPQIHHLLRCVLQVKLLYHLQESYAYHTSQTCMSIHHKHATSSHLHQEAPGTSCLLLQPFAHSVASHTKHRLLRHVVVLKHNINHLHDDPMNHVYY